MSANVNASVSGRGGTGATQLDADGLQAYLRHVLPELEGLSVERVWRNVGGMSRETWFADVSWGDGGERVEGRYTIRLDHPKGSVVPVPLWWEYRVLEALYGSEVPVARPVAFEVNSSWLGRAPFYVRETVPGTASPSELYAPGREEFRREIGAQFAGLLARVHTFDWQASGLTDFMPVPTNATECATLELRRWRDHYRARAVDPQPVMAELFSYLEQNAPAEVSRVSLVWGDVGVGNFIFDGGRIVALTDWEQSHLGDPMKDWASALWRSVDALLPAEELFEIYTEASGIPVNSDAIRYYLAFYDVECVCTSHPVVGEFLGGRTADATFARLALGIPFYCQDHALRTLGW
ncbi:MAG TPA: phosphotransferase family protein [Acidimicrobiales bacterium]|nr:phosphotransferase family protein [Acidimicrobiales bacterium]